MPYPQLRYLPKSNTSPPLSPSPSEGEGDYHCKQCPASFERAIDLANHVRKEHPKERQPKKVPAAIDLTPPLVATDGKTIISTAMKARAQVVEEVNGEKQGFRIMEDPHTKTRWLERSY